MEFVVLRSQAQLGTKGLTSTLKYRFQTQINMSVGDGISALLQGYTPSIILALTAVLLILRQRLAVQLDPQEPPILKPRIPYIGHIIGLLKYHTAYFDQL